MNRAATMREGLPCLEHDAEKHFRWLRRPSVLLSGFNARDRSEVPEPCPYHQAQTIVARYTGRLGAANMVSGRFVNVNEFRVGLMGVEWGDEIW